MKEEQIKKIVEYCEKSDLLKLKAALSNVDFKEVKNHILEVTFRTGNIKLLKFLITSGYIRINNLNEHHLEIAAKFGHLFIITFVLQHTRHIVDLNNVFMEAVAGGHLNVMQLLVEEYGVDATTDNHRAIMIASNIGNLECAKYLIEKGIDVTTDSNWSIVFAAKGGHLEVVKLLVENGADISSRNYLAIKSAERNEFTEIVEYLNNIKKEVDSNE